MTYKHAASCHNASAVQSGLGKGRCFWCALIRMKQSLFHVGISCRDFTFHVGISCRDFTFRVGIPFFVSGFHSSCWDLEHQYLPFSASILYSVSFEPCAAAIDHCFLPSDASAIIFVQSIHIILKYQHALPDYGSPPPPPPPPFPRRACAGCSGIATTIIVRLQSFFS